MPLSITATLTPGARAAAPGPLARDLLERPDPLDARAGASASNAADQAGRAVTVRAAGAGTRRRLSGSRWQASSSARPPADLVDELARAERARRPGRPRVRAERRISSSRSAASAPSSPTAARGAPRRARPLHADCSIATAAWFANRPSVREVGGRERLARPPCRAARARRSPLLVEERDAEDAVRRVADPLADVLRPARVLLASETAIGCPLSATPPAMPCPSGTRISFSSAARSPSATSNTQLLRRLVDEEERAARAAITLAAVSTIRCRRSEWVAGAAIVRAVAALASASRKRAASCSSFTLLSSAGDMWGWILTGWLARFKTRGGADTMRHSRRRGRVVRQRPAKPRTPVRFWSAPFAFAPEVPSLVCEQAVSPRLGVGSSFGRLEEVLERDVDERQRAPRRAARPTPRARRARRRAGRARPRPRHAPKADG